MKYFIIAGEASGDLHASNLIRELRKIDTQAIFNAWGGDLMRASGAFLEVHYQQMNFMGFAEVIANLRSIMRLLRRCKKSLLQFRPDVLILVDFPGFNLRIARFAYRHGIRVFYYISPQLWAWHSSRVHTLRKYTDRLYTILPFEKAFYARYKYDVEYVGHPLLDVLYTGEHVNGNLPEEDPPDDSRPLIALLPGSRMQEITRMLPVMAGIAKTFSEFRFVVAASTNIPDTVYKRILSLGEIPVIRGQTYNLLRKAHAAMITSGTATLEAAIIGTPQVVCYKGGRISFAIARQLVKVKYISLVNLILDKPLVTELIQQQFNSHNLALELRRICYDEENRERIRSGYKELTGLLGEPGVSARLAENIYRRLTNTI